MFENIDFSSEGQNFVDKVMVAALNMKINELGLSSPKLWLNRYRVSKVKNWHVSFV